jgi:lauroyl/myristoyl acyltransferase
MAKGNTKDGKQKKPTSRAFGKELGGIYKVVNFVHKYYIYKLFRFVPYSAVIGFSHFFTKAFFTRSKQTNERIKRNLVQFSGLRFSPKLHRRLVEAVLKNMALILFDVMLKAPNVTKDNYRKIARLENDQYLVDALKQGKGAIITSLHMGQFFHPVGAIALDPRGFKLVIVANMANQLMFENLVTLPAFKTAKVVGSAGFKDIKDELVASLKAGKVVFLMHDIAGNNNLKVPFLPGEKDFLMNLPQGAIALQRATGAPIVPVLAIPRGRFTHSTVRFFDPAPLLAASEKFKTLPQKSYHGLMSIEINKVMFPYLVKYLHTWEEIITTGTRTFDIKIRFPKGADLSRIVKDITTWVHGQIDGSFEPGRNDAGLLSWFDGLMTQLQATAATGANGEHVFQLARKTFTQVGGRGTRAQLEVLLKVLRVLYTNAALEPGARLLSENLGKVKDFYPRID